jgi:DNA-binding PadR family transcriptional regulator
VVEWVLLAMLVESPGHGFALAKALTPDGDLGRILTVRRPLVYRALDRLADDGLAAPVQTEPGDSGPIRTIFEPTSSGVAELDRWLEQPVLHVRDLRVAFLLKLRLLERLGRQPTTLIGRQRQALDHKIDRLAQADGDVVDLWRAHNALAVGKFLDEIEARAGRLLAT